MLPRIDSIGVLAALATILVIGASGCDGSPLGGSSYQREFGLADCTLVPTGRNEHFILEPGYRLVLEGEGMKVEITVLDETRVVDGVETRIVEEREWKAGSLFEVATNFFAICEQTKDVFYFGEEVDYYEDGKVVSHEGAWLAGRDGAKPGMIIPGAPKVGMKFYQEVAPGAAMDRAEILSLDETCTTPAGTFSKCMKVKEHSSLDFWSSLMFWQVEYKMHAPGIGLVQDEDLLLTKYGLVNKKQ